MAHAQHGSMVKKYNAAKVEIGLKRKRSLNFILHNVVENIFDTLKI